MTWEGGGGGGGGAVDGMDSQTFKIFVTGAGMVGWGGVQS